VKRREFITLLGGAAAASWPLAARAQQQAKLPTIGFLGASTRSAENEWIAAFVQRLRELGWVEGRTIAIEYRWSEGHDERLAEIAAEFVRRKVDVIVTWGTVSTIAAKQAMSVIPIVFAAMGDPLGTGIVASLARPGGNVTGLSALVTDVAGKRLELLREVVPGLRRLAIMFNVDAPASVLDMRGVQAAADTIGLEVAASEIRHSKDIAPAFDALKGHADALYVCTDPVVFTNLVGINILAAAARIPTMHGRREYVEGGGLISYGTNIPVLFRRAGDYVTSSSRFADSTLVNKLTPVALRAGRLKLTTMPSCIGSPAIKTVGISLVAPLAASSEGDAPVATINATRRPTRFAAPSPAVGHIGLSPNGIRW
jgi:putative ABC transport system substrate-binding protein